VRTPAASPRVHRRLPLIQACSFGGPQAAPGRALAQKSARRRHHSHGLGGRMARVTALRSFTGVDHRREEMQESEVSLCSSLPILAVPGSSRP
jgi:hypothetical protein